MKKCVLSTGGLEVSFSIYCDQILHTNACQYYPTTGMFNSLFWMDEGVLSIISAGCGHLEKMLITLEPHGVFESNFAYQFVLKLSRHWYAKW